MEQELHKISSSGIFQVMQINLFMTRLWLDWNEKNRIRINKLEFTIYIPCILNNQHFTMYLPCILTHQHFTMYNYSSTL